MRTGRPRKAVDMGRFFEIRGMVNDGLICKVEAAKLLKVSYSTFKRWYDEYRNIDQRDLVGKT